MFSSVFSKFLLSTLGTVGLGVGGYFIYKSLPKGIEEITSNQEDNGEEKNRINGGTEEVSSTPIQNGEESTPQGSQPRDDNSSKNLELQPNEQNDSIQNPGNQNGGIDRENSGSHPEPQQESSDTTVNP